MSRETVLQVSGDLESLHLARETLEEMLDSLGASPRASFVALLVLEEVGTNILKYAYADMPPPQEGAESEGFVLRLQNHPEEGFLRLTFEDMGMPFDPTVKARLEESSLEESKVGGRGLVLVQRMSRAMRYRRQGVHNLLEVDVDLNGA